MYTPRSCLVPGTVLSSMNATKSVTTMFKDMSAFSAKLNWQQLSERKKWMEKPRNNETPTIIMFLKLEVWVYCNVDKPKATIRAHMKHSTAAANARGIDARIAPTFPIKYNKKIADYKYLQEPKSTLNNSNNIANIIPTKEKRIKKTDPSCRALRLATLVTSIVCTFSVNVVDAVPVPQSPASILQNPSKPIPRLTIPGVGGFRFILIDAE
nr:RNA polymerase II transcription factor B subunit 4 [Ipomoea trifida]